MSLSDMHEWLGSPDWMRDAECQNEPMLPWTVDGPELDLYQVRAMVAVCAACPVLVDCLRYVEETPEGDLWGFWAGETRPGTEERHLEERRAGRSRGWRRRARDDGFAELDLFTRHQGEVALDLTGQPRLDDTVTRQTADEATAHETGAVGAA